jgi:hypothetical protein
MPCGRMAAVSIPLVPLAASTIASAMAFVCVYESSAVHQPHHPAHAQAPWGKSHAPFNRPADSPLVGIGLVSSAALWSFPS